VAEVDLREARIAERERDGAASKAQIAELLACLAAAHLHMSARPPLSGLLA
jgi:hypothetical protein